MTENSDGLAAELSRRSAQRYQEALSYDGGRIPEEVAQRYFAEMLHDSALNAMLCEEFAAEAEEDGELSEAYLLRQIAEAYRRAVQHVDERENKE